MHLLILCAEFYLHNTLKLGDTIKQVRYNLKELIFFYFAKCRFIMQAHFLVFVYNYKWILSIYSLLSYLPTSFELNSCENLARGQGHGRGPRMETPSPDRKRF